LLLLDISEADAGASYLLLHSGKQNGVLDSNPCPHVSHLKSMSFSRAAQPYRCRYFDSCFSGCCWWHSFCVISCV